MTEAVPDWVSRPYAPVHTTLPSSYQWQTLSADQLKVLRERLVESILQVVVQALNGIFVPGNVGAAFDQLRDWVSNNPLVRDIVEAITGVIGDNDDLSAFFNDLLGLLGNPTGLGTGSPVLGSLADTPLLRPVQDVIDTLTGLTNSSMSDLIDWVTGLINPDDLMQLNDLVTAITGADGDNTYLNTFFNDLRELLGNPTGLGTGNPVPASNFANIPILGPLFALFGGASTSTQADNFFTNLQAIFNNIDLTISPDDFPSVVIPSSNVDGIQNVIDIGASIQNIVDNLASAWNSNTIVGATLTDLGDLAQQVQSLAYSAFGLGESSYNTLAYRNNQPASVGLESTVEATFPVLLMQGTTNPPVSIAATATSAPMGLIRINKTDTKTWLQWLGNGATNITTAIMNVYKLNADNTAFTLLHTSGDLHSSLGSSWTWQTYSFTTGTDVSAGDILAAELIVTGSGTHNIAGTFMSWMPQHPTSRMKSIAATRNPATLGASPASIPYASIGWSTSSMPWMGLGIGTPPAINHLAETATFTTAGTYSYTVPSWFVTGRDFLETVDIGAGGGGGSGTGGAGGPGGATSITIGAITLSAPAGAGGPSGPLTTGYENAFGRSPGNYTYQGVTYYGGTGGGPQQTGNGAGAGGGGGQFWPFVGQGGEAGSWRALRFQPSVRTGTVTIGAGGAGQFNYAAGHGAPGKAWIVARQNVGVQPAGTNALFAGQGALKGKTPSYRIAAFAGHGSWTAAKKVPLTGFGALTATTSGRIPRTALLAGRGRLAAQAIPKVIYNSIGAGAVNTSGSTPQTTTQSHTISRSGTTTVLLAFIAVQSGSDNAAIGTYTRAVTYAGQTMTSLGSLDRQAALGHTMFGEWFYLFNPPTGSANVSTTLTHTGSTGQATLIYSVAYDNVADVRSLTTAIATNTFPTISMPVTITDMAMGGAFSTASASFSAPTGTNRAQSNFGYLNIEIQESQGTSPRNLSATMVANNGFPGQLAFVLSPPTIAGSRTPAFGGHGAFTPIAEMVYDDFNGAAGTAPSTSRWAYDLGGGGWGNGELQTFTDSTTNCFQDGSGNLVIRATKDGSGNYFSTRLVTRDKFTMGYGTLSSRIKVAPLQTGIASAFWTVGVDWTHWPGCGETDIFEIFPVNETINCTTVVPGGFLGQFPTYNRQSQSATTLPSGYHTYWCRHEENLIVLGMDNTTINTITPATCGGSWVFNLPNTTFMLFCIAVGNSNTLVGNPDGSTTFPTDMLIDWVRWRPL